MRFKDYEFDFTDISRSTYKILIKWGVPESIATFVNLFILLTALIIAVYLLHNVLRRLLRITLIRIVKTTRFDFFLHLLENRFAHYIALLAAVSLIRNALPAVFHSFHTLTKVLIKLTDAYLVILIIWVLITFIKSGAESLRKRATFRSKPIESYLQVIRIIFYLIATVIIFTILTGKDLYAAFAAMGAASAVLLLMFKDTIMGFVASIQVSTNDTVRIGDWITMPKYGADGDVMEINLTTVKVQNFDKTITTIPTYSLVSDSFQNWRGMSESGGRRIKRAIFIRQSTIRFINPEELEEFRKIQSLTAYIDHRQKDINKNNERVGADKTLLINGRNLTNAGLYRKYIDNYISNHSGIHKKMTMMVRQLAPTSTGLPIEIYAFTGTTKWIDYEYIMADIFDHLLASAKFFDLQIYEMEVLNPDQE